jgi:radical SAM superfamily enzyme YgiQ (UPF0313 family)
MTSITDQKKNILLIPVQDNLSHLGVKYLHYSLLENGFQSKLLFIPYLEMNDSKQLKILQEFISQMDPLYLGLSLTSLDYFRTRDLASFIKKTFPDLPLICGGVHPTVDPESCMSFADYVMIGEGEKSVLDFSNALINGTDIKEVPNLCYRENGQLKKNSLAPAIKDLDSLPLFDHIPKHSFIQRKDGKIRVIDKDIYAKEGRFQGRIYEMLSSRGCAFSCTYCTNNFFNKIYPSNKRVRRRSVKNIIGELEHVIKKNPEIKQVVFHDSSFLICSKEYVREFCETYKKKINIPFIVSTMPHTLNREKLILLKEAGVSWITMGLQSGSDQVNKNIYKRHVYKKDFLHAAKLIRDLNLPVKSDVIMDNPFENKSEAIETIETLIETPKPLIIEFFSLTLLPGTELYDRVNAECPEKMEDCRGKNYAKVKETYLNKLTVLAVNLPKSLMKKLMQLYKANPNGSGTFKVIFYISKVISACYYRPKNLLHWFKLMCGDSYAETIRTIPLYVKDYFSERRNV